MKKEARNLYAEIEDGVSTAKKATPNKDRKITLGEKTKQNARIRNTQGNAIVTKKHEFGKTEGGNYVTPKHPQ